MMEENEVQTQNSIMPASAGRMLSFLIMLALTFAGVFLLSPLGRVWLSRDPIANAMPTHTGVYIAVDMLSLFNDESQDVLDAFQPALDQINEMDEMSLDANDPQSFVDEIEKNLPEDADITFAEDILPWVGPRVGVGMIDFTMKQAEDREIDFGDGQTFTMPGTLEPVLGWLAALTIRDQDVALGFEDKLKNLLTESEMAQENEDYQLTHELYQNVTIYYYAPQPTEEAEEIMPMSEMASIAFARSNNIFYFGKDIETIKQGVNAQNGESLADTAAYKKAMSEMPSTAFYVMYMDAEKVFTWAQEVEKASQAMTNNMMTNMGNESLPECPSQYDAFLESGLEGMAVGISITRDGFQMDSFANYDVDAMPEATRNAMENYGQEMPAALTYMPEDTYLYIGSKTNIEVAWETQQEQIDDMIACNPGGEMAMTMFKESLGFDPFMDLFPYLGREVAIALIPTEDGMLSQTSEMNIGMVMLMGSLNDEALMSVTGSVAERLEMQGLPANLVESDDLNLYEIVNFYTPDQTPIFSFGVGHQYLIMSSMGSEGVEALFSEHPSLADSLKFQDVQSAFPRDMVVNGYIDLRGMMELFPLESTSEALPWVEPFKAMGMANTYDHDNGTTHGRMIIFIEAAEGVLDQPNA